MSPSGGRRAAWILLLASLAAAGRGRADDPSRRAASVAASAEPVAVAASGRPATRAEELAGRFDPADDSWSSEVLSAAAGARLEVLEDLLEGRRPIAAGTLAPLVADGFATSPLRPEALVSVFDGGAFRVRRWTPPSSAPPHRGAPGLAAALSGLADALAGDGEVDVALKITRIETSGPTFTTRVLVQASRRSPGLGLQLNASWRCRWETSAAPRLLDVALERFEEITASGGALFADATASVLGHNAAYREQVLPGIGHWLGRLTRLSGMSLFGHHGLAVGDVDGDGLEDLYVCDAGGLPNRLYRQNADGTATDVSAAAGVDWLEATASALLVDLDGDGDQDLVAATRRLLLVAENDGDGRFTLRRPLPGVVASPASLAAADYDGDGDLDLYVCGYDGDPESSGLPGPYPYHDAENGGRNALLRNEGGLELVDVTAETGLEANNTRFSFAAAWEDYDDDGDLDLYVANDFGRNNLYRNDGATGGRVRFTDVAPEAGVEDVASGMSVAWGDPDRDGRMDLYVSNMYSSAGNRIAYQRAFADAAGAATGDLRRMARGNSLFLNAGDGSFRDVSQAAGVTMGRWAWASRFADLDNDGWEDLVVANGYVTNEDSGDL